MCTVKSRRASVAFHSRLVYDIQHPEQKPLSLPSLCPSTFPARVNGSKSQKEVW
jgi:hypothetical protein